MLVLLTVVCFAQCLNFGFVATDDAGFLGQNSAVNPPTWAGLRDRWAGPYMGLYTPITHTAWAIIGLLARTDAPPPPEPTGSPLAPGLDPAWFHLASMGVHVAAVLVVYLLLRRLIASGDRWPEAVGAAVFAIHPLQAESVSWASELKDLLCGLFIACSLLLTVRVAPRLRHATLSASLLLMLLPWLAMLLAIGSKPTAVVTPLLLLAVVMVYRVPRARLVAIAIVGLLLVVFPAYLADRFQAQPSGESAIAYWQRPLVVLDTYGFYASKLLLPVSLCMDYGRSPSRVLASSGWIQHALVLLIALVGVFALARWTKRPGLIWCGVALLAVPLLPVSGLRPHLYAAISTVADHYLYPGMVGFSLLLATALHTLLERLPTTRRFCLALSVICIALLSVLTFRQAATWRDSQTLFSHTLAVNPNSVLGNTGMAFIASQNNAADRARELAERSLVHLPDHAPALFIKASVLAGRGEYKPALDILIRAGSNVQLLRNPSYQSTVGDVMMGLGRYGDAAVHYRNSLRFRPDQPDVSEKLKAAETRNAERAATTRPAA